MRTNGTFCVFAPLREISSFSTGLAEGKSVSRKAAKFAEKPGAMVTLLILLLSFSQSATMAQKRKTMVDLIIRGGTVVTMDQARQVIENGAVASKGGRIVAVGRTA